MRVMMANLMIVVLSAAFFVYANGIDTFTAVNNNSEASPQNLTGDVLDIMKKHFDHSLDYLYTGVHLDSQYGERPGLAKKLRGMSDAEWEAGMAALNKFLEHGGSTGNEEFIGKLNFRGGETAAMHNAGTVGTYSSTLKKLSTDTQDRLDLYNAIFTRAITNDGDIAHYLEEKIEKEVERRHELKGQIVTFEAMKDIGAAVATFDSNM